MSTKPPIVFGFPLGRRPPSDFSPTFIRSSLDYCPLSEFHSTTERCWTFARPSSDHSASVELLYGCRRTSTRLLSGLCLTLQTIII
ncbi:hypothetical protein MA16_Dca017610 [Dendrobium catenatum]|uniref:Uncharacterized protein n=1 Tax=Dendrobium catenatum TaxID=906689 RepID=A0A2I0XIW1_9ASPA|nr:hypothetical protein MA16_Dca017610 [Dendrobium catenatum]